MLCDLVRIINRSAKLVVISDDNECSVHFFGSWCHCCNVWLVSNGFCVILLEAYSLSCPNTVFNKKAFQSPIDLDVWAGGGGEERVHLW